MKTMTAKERKESARKHLTSLCPIGTKLYVIRTDEGRRNFTQFYYAVLCDTDTEMGLQNISGHVARLLGRKWSNVIWPNASAVLHRNAEDMIEELACALHGIDANLGGKQSLTSVRL